MTQDSKGAGAAHSSSWPSGGGSGDVADSPASPMSAAASGAMAHLTLASILTVAGIILLFVVFAVGLVSLQYCFNAAWDDRERRRQQQGSGHRGRRRGGMSRRTRTTARGVDPEVLRSLPVTVYHRAAPPAGSEKEAAEVECAVCLAELEDGEAARFLPRCGHGFHAECVDTWLASHTTCPLCRLTVAKPDDAPPALLPPEPANYAGTNLPASVLLGVSVSDHGAVAAGGDTGVMVIEIPERAVPAPTPRDAAAKSPGSARLRSSFRRLWSFGRQGAGPSSSCTCAGAGEGADLEHGVSSSTDRPESNTKILSSLQ